MRFIRTRLATDFEESSRLGRFFAIDNANPNYRGKYHLVRYWLIEFVEDDLPWREIGLDEDGAIVLAGPSESDYGFWLDTNMRYADFVGEPISKAYFEQIWAASGVIAP
jgi:hypothetical protein